MPFYAGQVDYIAQLNAVETNAARTTYSTTDFAAYDATDVTKILKFSVTGFTTATTNTFSFPNGSYTVAVTGALNQTFSGQTTFSNANVTFGSSTAASTVNVASGATVSGSTKAVNIGTGGVSGSTTNIVIGSTFGTTITLNAAPTSATGYKIGTTTSTDANTLDYYQEGSFTPVVAGTTTAGAGTYTTQAGRYTRIGNRVFFNLQIVQTAHTGTGNMVVTGLPFTSESTMRIPLDLRCDSLTFTGQLSAYVQSNSTQIVLETLASGATPTALAMDTACSFWISGQYLVP